MTFTIDIDYASDLKAATFKDKIYDFLNAINGMKGTFGIRNFRDVQVIIKADLETCTRIRSLFDAYYRDENFARPTVKLFKSFPTLRENLDNDTFCVVWPEGLSVKLVEKAGVLINDKEKNP